MNILPTAYKENAENAPPSPTKRRPTKKGTGKTGPNVLGATYRFPHSNSPTKKGDRQNSSSSLRGERKQQTEQKNDRRHIQWVDETISPTSLARDLDETLAEQGWCNNGNGVYFHDETTQPPHDLVSIHDGKQSTPNKVGSFSPDSLPGSQRTGLQHRFSIELPKESSSISINDGVNVSPDITACRRIIRSDSFRPKYSATIKRRMIVMSFALGFSLLGYFVEVRQIMNSQAGQGGVSSDWLISLPRSFSSSILGGENGDVSNARMEEAYFTQPTHNTISMKTERKRVQSRSKSRSERRRMRTKPPSAYPTIPAAIVGAALVEDVEQESSPLPRLVLDLPSHRELDNALVDHRSLQATNDGNSNTNDGRRRLLRAGQQSGPSLCGPQAQEASQLNPNHYPESAYIGPKSRVVVTGAMSQVGVELILQLHEQCGVQFIVGIDAAYPNTRHNRIDMIESRYKYIQRRVPGFQRLIVPVFGIHPHPKMGEEERFESMGNGFDLVSRLKPTHIVHLAGMEEGRGEHIDYGDTVDASPFAESGKSSMMRRFDSLLSMDQVLSSLAKFNKAQEGGGGDMNQPQLVYVSSDEADAQSGVSLKNGASTPYPASVYGTSCLLNEVLSSYYHRHHGVDSVGLRVPTVFGPFPRPGSLLHDLAERTVRNAAGKDVEGVPKYHLDRDRYELSSMWSKREGAMSGAMEQVVYVYDVAAAIMAAMQFKNNYASSSIDPNGPTLMRIGSTMTTSMNELKDRMEGYLPPADQLEAEATPTSFLGDTQELNAFSNSPGLSIYDTERNRDLLGWTHKTGIHEGTKSMLAWQILKAYPFGLPESVPSHSTFHSILEDSRPSLSYHSLPCAAGCRWEGGMCTKSVWDAVIDTTNEITKTCPYVLYTVDLRPELVSLEKQSAPSQRSGWEDYFCKIAFVSSSSKLAETIYSYELKEKTPMDEWNGKGKSGHWIIVALPGSQYDTTEYERSLAKITPTNLFSDTVEKAMYLNHRRVILSTDQAMGVMRHTEMNERTAPKRKTIVDEKTKENLEIYLQPQTHRHSVFFTNKFSFADGFDTSSAKNLARFVMANAGIAETKDIRAQVQFYEETGHLTRTNMQRSPNYQEFNQDNFFPYDFLRSTWLVHTLKSEEGRNLRCEMYEEHALWGNREMEDLSMGYVLAKRKVKMQLGKIAEPQYEGPEEWYPLLVPREPDDEDAITEGSVHLDYQESAQKVATDSKGHEYYVTFLPQKRKE